MKIPKIFELPPPSCYCFIILRLVCFRIILPRPRPSTYQLATRAWGSWKCKKKTWHSWTPTMEMVGRLKLDVCSLKKTQLGVFLFEVPKLVFQESTPQNLCMTLIQQFIFAVVTHLKWHIPKVCFFERCCRSWKFLLQTYFYEKWTFEMDDVIRGVFNTYKILQMNTNDVERFWKNA